LTTRSDTRPARLEALFRALVAVYSPFDKEEEVLELLETFCAEQGVSHTRQPVDGERYNLVLGRPDAPLVFVGHVDTVEAWDLDAVGPRDLGDGRVAGLGTADMKGGCAAMLEAYLVLRDRGLGNRLGVALVVGEEAEGDGAAAFLHSARPGRVIVGEPTGLTLCAGHYGYVEAAFRAIGRSAHASLPELGENAAEALLRALHDLIGAGGLRGELGAVVNIRHLETGWAGFAVPARARAWVDLHVPPEVSVQALCQDVERLLTRCGQTAVEVTFPTVHAGYQRPDDDPVVQAYRAAWGGVPDIFRSHSDANLFHAAGVPAYVLGPGHLETAHSEEEHVDLAEIQEAARRYVALAEAVLGTESSGHELV